jgi:hypothetical protein
LPKGAGYNCEGVELSVKFLLQLDDAIPFELPREMTAEACKRHKRSWDAEHRRLPYP